MVFSSLEFLFIFLPLFLLCYFIVPKKVKIIVLCFFSLVFYAWGEPVYILLMIFSSVFNFVCGLILEKQKNATPKKITLIIAIIVNLGLLGFFKYTDFAIGTFNSITHSNFELLNIALPIGISFFTFQTMSYTIDVYRGSVACEHNFLIFITYVSMFPQLIAGPIVRYETVAKELHNRTITYEKFCQGLFRFMQGLFKKVLIANNMGLLFSTVTGQDYSTISVASAWLAACSFTFQIYFDFSGYSDMAIGIGKMIGFTYLENFNYPLTATSVTDFWRRWHISLSSFFRDYVYIPLGGNRCSVPRHILNLMIVWGLTGMWHGAAFNFILWGLYYGVLLILEKYVWGKYLEKTPAFFKHFYSVFIIVFGFTIFTFDDMNLFGKFAKIMFFASGNSLIDKGFFNVLINHGFILAVAIIISAPVYKLLTAKIENIIKTSSHGKAVAITHAAVAMCFYTGLFIITVSYLVNDSYNPFLYFRF